MKKVLDFLKPYKAPIFTCLILSLFGTWWGLPLRFYEDESVLQQLNLDILKGEWEKGVYFQYGNLAQIIHCLFIWPALFMENQASWAVFLARCGSALFAALIPALLGETAKALWNEKTARWTAWSAAFSPALITYGHFGTVDVLQLFFLSLALCSAARFPLVSLFRTGFICGLGTAIKFQAWLMIFPALILFFLSSRQRPRFLILLFLGLILGFLTGMPWLWLYPGTALKWALHHFNVDGVSFALSGSGHAAWLAHPANALTLLNPLLFAAAFLGFAISFSPRFSSRIPSLMVLFSWLPFYLLSGSFQIAPARQSLALIPAALLYAGRLLSLDEFKRIRLPVLGLSAAFAVWLVSGFLFDSRFAAARWIEKNIPLHATAEITPYAPELRIPLMVWSRYSPPRDPLNVKPLPSWASSPVQRVLPEDLRLVNQKSAEITEPDADNYTPPALARRGTQLVLLTDWYVERYRYLPMAEANPNRAAYYLGFWENAQPGYALIKRFKFFPKAWWAPKPEFVDPEIRLYSKVN